MFYVYCMQRIQHIFDKHTESISDYDIIKKSDEREKK